MVSKLARIAFVSLATALPFAANASMLRSTAEHVAQNEDRSYQALVSAANAVVGVKVKALKNVAVSPDKAVRFGVASVVT